ncbi:MAG TPA: homoserine kinase [Candidatus Acidoferrales bacterium]|nr:homoserine kinase [Candidatus Acidoferrales bacterium]
MKVRVPASSANLGPGFDSFAVALPLLAEYEVRAGRTWTFTTNGDGLPAGDDNLFVVAARAVAKAAGKDIAPQHVEQHTAIPVSRGLGSSAAAIVGGAVAANTLLGEPLDRRTLLRVASEVEGHADNVAAALYGALTVTLPDDHGPYTTRIPFPSAWRVCVYIPSAHLETEKARGLLSAQVTRADAVFNLAHAAALVAAVMRSDGALLSVAMADRLHQEARTTVVPALAEIIAAARDAGAFGAALSGAGPSVLAIAPVRLAPRVVAAMEETAVAHGVGGRGRMLRVRAAGAQVRER